MADSVDRVNVSSPASETDGSTRPPAVAPTHANVKYGPHGRNLMDVWLAKSDPADAGTWSRFMAAAFGTAIWSGSTLNNRVTPMATHWPFGGGITSKRAHSQIARIEHGDQAEATIAVPSSAKTGDTIHIVCQVNDQQPLPLTHYQRVILTVVK